MMMMIAIQEGIGHRKMSVCARKEFVDRQFRNRWWVIGRIACNRLVKFCSAMDNEIGTH
jgi:hypothetical protein